MAALRPFADGYQAALLPLEDPIIAAFLAGWRHAVNYLPNKRRIRAAAEAPSEEIYRAAVAFAERYAAELIVEISDATRQGVRVLVARAFRDGIPPTVLARLILQDTTLGLTARATQALLTFRARLAAAAPGTQVLAGTRRYHIPDEGLSATRQAEAVSAYAERLLLERSQTIARTATIRAASAGQHAAWVSAVDRGDLPSDQTKRWTAAPGPRTCIICLDLDGQEVGLYEPFFSRYVGLLPYPPVHPNCRCSVVLG